MVANQQQSKKGLLVAASLLFAIVLFGQLRGGGVPRWSSSLTAAAANKNKNKSAAQTRNSGGVVRCRVTSTTGTAPTSSSARQCPGKIAYRPSCREHRVNHTLPSPDSLPKLEDPEHFMDHLLETFHDRRVVFLGDSLSRQWYETLSCRLGLDQMWFQAEMEEYESSLPPRLIRARDEYGLHFLDMHIPPSDMKSALGYSIADRSSSSPAADGTTSSMTRLSCSQEGEEHQQQHNVPFQSTLEYFHLDQLTYYDGELALLQNVSTPSLFEFLFSESDVIVFNLGVHYGADFSLIPDVQSLMKFCARARDRINSNSDAQASNTHRHRKKVCVYREILPQHFQYIERNDTDGSPVKFPPNFQFNRTFVDPESCGPFDRNVNPFLFRNTPRVFAEMARSYDIPVVEVQELLRDAWEWHKGPPDCTHFCQDPELWDLVHERLVAELSSL